MMQATNLWDGNNFTFGFWCCDNFFNTHVVDILLEYMAIDGVPVSEQILWGLIIWKCFYILNFVKEIFEMCRLQDSVSSLQNPGEIPLNTFDYKGTCHMLFIIETQVIP